MKRIVMIDYTNLTEYQKDKYIRRRIRRRRKIQRIFWWTVAGTVGFLGFAFVSSIPYMLFGYDYC